MNVINACIKVVKTVRLYVTLDSLTSEPRSSIHTQVILQYNYMHVLCKAILKRLNLAINLVSTNFFLLKSHSSCFY